MLSACAAIAWPAAAQVEATGGELVYRRPLAPIARILDAPVPPFALPSPAGDAIALLSRPALPSIAELAEPELGLAGVTIHPRHGGPSRTAAYGALVFRGLAGRQAVSVALPPRARLIAPAWSPDGRRLAFLLLGEAEVELWVADAASGAVRRLAGRVSAGLPRAFEWLPDSSGLLLRLVPSGRGEAPAAPSAPAGPVVRETGGAAAAQTLSNLLADAHDEALFEHHFTSQLALVRLDGAPPVAIGRPAIIAETSVSPDGRFILRHLLVRPFSYSLPASAFPTRIDIVDLGGAPVRVVADRPALFSLSAVTPGRRAVQWRADAPATLVWAEAGDGALADRLFALEAPFTGPPVLLATLAQRFQAFLWGRDDLAVVIATAPAERREYRLLIDPSRPGAQRVLQRRDYRGGAEAGTILTRAGRSGRDRLHFTPDGNGLFVATRAGLARLDLASSAIAPVWRAGRGETLVAPLDAGATRLLTRRESASVPPNLFVVDRSGRSTRVTDFTDPAPEFAQVTIRRIEYRRADGVPLRGRLHLPAGHDPARDGPLLTLVWAYPQSVDAAELGAGAGGGNDRFVRPGQFDDLPLLLVTRGYALFEAAMPIVGAPGQEANDSHVPQLVANARAAVDALVGAGVAERGRVAIGGHSYGAAMVANLLAHSDLFAAGIALSGAYNRTLTPFGFQASERRTLWEGRDAYLAMSPFLYADRIAEPLLLVHGAADSNNATLPIQSERMYTAIQATGGTARYVLLPGEGHQYRARESLMHLMWEMDRWLGLHLRSTAPPPASPGH